MKIKSLKLKNFAKFTDFEIEYDSKITRLIGINGSGKTTVGVTAIWACLKGIAEKNSNGQLLGERFRFIGSEGKSANIELTLFDEQKNIEIVVTNHITKASNQIKFEGPEGHAIDESWLKDLLSVSLMSAKNFTELDSKAQALMLGIDPSDHDKAIDEIKSEFTLLNRDLKNLGQMNEPPKVEAVSINDLLIQKETIENKNQERQSVRLALEAKESQVAALVRSETELLEQIKGMKEKHSILIDGIKSLNSDLYSAKIMMNNNPTLDTTKINTAIVSAESTNAKAEQYKQFEAWQTDLSKASFKVTSNRELLKKKERARLDYIKSFKFGLKGISVDEKGGLLLNDRPIKSPYFSKGELEIIVAKLHSFINPDLKVRFIDDFELLDEDNQKLIVDSLLESGFQLITAEVGKAKKDENSILLRECNIED